MLALNQEQIVKTVNGLNKAYPNGWRSNDPTTDALTVFLFNGLQQMMEVIFTSKRQQ